MTFPNRIVLEGQMEEQTGEPKKLHALIQESSVGVQTQLSEKKSSDNLELVIYSFTVEVQWFILKKTIIFHGFRGLLSFSKGFELFFFFFLFFFLGGGGGGGG